MGRNSPQTLTPNQCFTARSLLWVIVLAWLGVWGSHCKRASADTSRIVLATERVQSTAPAQPSPASTITPLRPVQSAIERPTTTITEQPIAAGPWSEELTLDTGPFSSNGQPSVIVHAPAGWTAQSSVNVVVFLHGWYECVRAVASTNDVPCERGAHASMGLDVVQAFDRSNTNALLVIPQLAFNVKSGEPGRWIRRGLFRTFLTQAIAQSINRHAPATQQRTAENVQLGRVIIAGHSAGYQVVSAVIDRGNVDEIREVYLLDCSYNIPHGTTQWIDAHLHDFQPGRRDGYRLVLLYTEHPRSVPRSLALADRVAHALPANVRAQVVHVNDEHSAFDPTDLQYPFLVRRVRVRHPYVPKHFLPDLLRTSGLPSLQTVLPSTSQ